MKIANICPAAPYNEGWSYQENLLPKYQAKLGHDVYLVITNTCHKNGTIVETNEERYRSEGGFEVIRISRKKHLVRKLDPILYTLKDLYRVLCEIRPDFVFFHGLVSDSIFDVVKYKKKHNKNLVIVQDNHLDYNIGLNVHDIRSYVKRMIYRIIFKSTQKYISCVYGVTPWRKEYAEDYFDVPQSLLDVLIMGADDEKINFSERETIRERIRNQYSISEDTFLILSGGKIESNKKIDVLLDGVKNLEGVKLILFGSIDETIKEDIEKRLKDNSNCIYIGWIKSELFYDYCFAADLVLFPGQHSVLWEQACASKTPCVFARWPGMDHVDAGGNCLFLDDVSPKGIRTIIKRLSWTTEYYRMKDAALSPRTDVFLYSRIAKKSLEYAEQ